MAPARLNRDEVGPLPDRSGGVCCRSLVSLLQIAPSSRLSPILRDRGRGYTERRLLSCGTQRRYRDSSTEQRPEGEGGQKYDIDLDHQRNAGDEDGQRQPEEEDKGSKLWPTR